MLHGRTNVVKFQCSIHCAGKLARFEMTISLIGSSSYNGMLLYETDKAQIPRQWLNYFVNKNKIPALHLGYVKIL